MKLKSVKTLSRPLPHLAIAALGVGWVFPSGVQASVEISREFVGKSVASSLVFPLPQNPNSDDDDVRDDDKDKKDREG